MSLFALADRLVTVSRQTKFSLDATAALATMSADRQPASASRLEVRVWGGTANTGTVTVSGTVDGASDSEALTFTEAGYKTTQKQFSAIEASGIVTTGLADETTVPSIQITTVGRDGSAISMNYAVVTEWPMAFIPKTSSWPQGSPGSAEIEMGKFAFERPEIWSPREGDVFVDTTSNDSEWLVVGVPQFRGQLYQHHWEVKVQRREGSLP